MTHLDIDMGVLDIRAKLAEIDRALAQTDQARADILRASAQTDQARADAERKRQEVRFAPWQIGLSLLTLTAAAFAAGAAAVKLLGGG